MSTQTRDQQRSIATISAANFITALGILYLQRAFETYMLWDSAVAGSRISVALDLLMEVKPFSAQVISSVN
jgi:hypothetical protein